MIKANMLPLPTVINWEPTMARLGVSEVARSPRGFLRAYKSSRGMPSREWLARREGFVARHLAQMVKNDEPLYGEDGLPTRRHLALVAWAYSPDPTGLRLVLSKTSGDLTRPRRRYRL